MTDKRQQQSEAGRGPGAQRPDTDAEQVDETSSDDTTSESSGAGADASADESADVGPSGSEADVDALVSVEDLRSAAGSLKQDVDQLTQERDAHLDQLQRVQAEFQNYKKRMMREQTEMVDRASQRIAEAMLPALESLDLAVDSARRGDGDGDAVADGLVAVRSQLNEILEKEGLERIEPAPGTPVDHEVHEPVARAAERPDTSEAEEAAQGPMVTKTLRPGFRMKGKLIRPAMVEFSD